MAKNFWFLIVEKYSKIFKNPFLVVYQFEHGR